MPVPPYSKPPITEAVVELRFDLPADERAVRRVAGSLNKKYARSEEQAQVTFTVRPNGPPHASASFSGFKLAKSDQSEIAVISRASFSRSMLPPYAGFDVFRASILEDLQACQPAYSGKKFVRLGMRFINRIDIPSPDAIDLGAYLRVVVSMPDLQQGPLYDQTCRVVMPLPASRTTCFINVATTPSPMIKHHSVVLDIEIARDVDLPQKTTEVFQLIDEMRDIKNQVFEACITDAARSLFGGK